MAEMILLSWSGGKDSAFTLHELQKSGAYQVASLVTTVTEGFDRISMHGVRRALLEQQAESIGIPLDIVWISQRSSNEEYEAKMRVVLEKYQQAGIERVAFGDIFLEDLRRYRETNLARIGMKALFPLWKRDTGEMARSFVQEGFRAFVCCVDTQALDGRFVGREFDERFLADLPATVDPCGENGEFHSFVFGGPIFGRPVPVQTGEITLRDERFNYCDLIPA